MAWITYIQVEPLVQTDLSTDEWIDDLISHVEGLAEVEIGAQTEPVSTAIQTILAQIVARMWRAGRAASTNPAGFQSETSPEYGYSVPTGSHLEAGFGLTYREKKDLRKAAGLGGLWVQPLTSGTLETSSISMSTDSDVWEGA